MVAAKLREFRFVGAGEFMVEVAHLPAAWRIESAQNIEQGRFAAAGRAEQHHQLAAKEIEVDATQRLHRDFTHVVSLGEAACDEDRMGGGGRSHGCGS
jgi:hypothetical protein